MASISPYEAGLSTRHPYKAIYVFYAIVVGLFKFPLWLLYFIPSGLRQHPQYSYRQAVGTEFLRHFLHTSSAIRIITPLVLEPGPFVKDKSRFVRFGPSAEKTKAPEGGRYTGIASISPQVRPVESFGVWYPEKPSGTLLDGIRKYDSSPRVVLHFHGGAFALGNPRPDYSGYMGGILSKKLGPTFCASYRLASNPHGAFPAALQDAISAYAYLLTELRIPANRVLFSGDSAGGNLAVALLRYIQQYPESGLPLPAGALLWSPWLDVSAALNPERISESPNAKTDYITPNFAYWGASTITPTSSAAVKDTAADGMWLSPLKHPFHLKVPMWILAGGTEVMFPDIVAYAEVMQKIKGNNVELHIEPIGHHDIVLVAPYAGFHKEATHAVDAAHKWLKGLPKA